VFDGSSCACTDFTLTVGGGTWDSEISWDLGSYSGGAGAYSVCLEDGDHTFNGADAYGDGWNGGSWILTDADGNVVASGAVEGDSGSWTFCVGADCAPPSCDDDAACNTGDEGDCTYPSTGFNCDGSVADGYFEDCVGGVFSDSYLSWVGDGYCDDGAYGIDFVACGDYNCDDGDCGTELLEDGTCGIAAVLGCTDEAAEIPQVPSSRSSVPQSPSSQL
jgi:hypothetical protein